MSTINLSIKVSDACQINDLNAGSLRGSMLFVVSDACQINDLNAVLHR